MKSHNEMHSALSPVQTRFDLYHDNHVMDVNFTMYKTFLLYIAFNLLDSLFLSRLEGFALLVGYLIS